MLNKAPWPLAVVHIFGCQYLNNL